MAILPHLKYLLAVCGVRVSVEKIERPALKLARTANPMPSARELQVLDEWARGEMAGISRAKVAEGLLMAEATLERHFDNLRAKMGTPSTAGAYIKCLYLGLLEVPQPAALSHDKPTLSLSPSRDDAHLCLVPDCDRRQAVHA